jgi:hypothetical protein
VTYRVRAIRSGRWWAIEFDDVDRRIHSQAKRLDQVPAMAADAISISLGVAVDPSEVDVDVVLPKGELRRTVEHARRLRSAANESNRRSVEAMRRAVAAGRAHGLSTRDVGALLDVSFQYVSRLQAESRAADG